jgi:hypothetical protein
MRVIVLAIMTLGSLLAQDAIVQRKANLLPSPSASEAPDAVLQAGDRVSLLDPTPEHGYYQVKTADGKDGWVSLRSIRVIKTPSASEPAIDPETVGASGPVQCDDTLWTHVYHPNRLIVKQPCIAVTGTIVDATNGAKSDGVRHEADGDTHRWLKVDPQFANLLNPGNMSNEGSNLVFEIVCKFVPPSQADAKPACTGYTSSTKIPPVGSHVEIVGAYVRDTNHAQWMEIHPVTSITVK